MDNQGARSRETKNSKEIRLYMQIIQDLTSVPYPTFIIWKIYCSNRRVRYRIISISRRRKRINWQTSTNFLQRRHYRHASRDLRQRFAVSKYAQVLKRVCGGCVGGGWHIMQCDWLTFWRYFDFLYGVNTRQRCKSALNKRPNQAIRFYEYFTLISHSVSYYTSSC